MGSPLSLSFSQKKRNKIEIRNKGKRGLRKEFGHGVNLLGLTKMCTVHEKTGVARLQELNSKSFEFNSNGLNKK